ncbi:NUDIX hydrolase [Thalassotalea mangrovi]|uniref:NUDIX domain-containing protein n=1 Tax=Thalassotalea mangrovi TaxID=2572245 RepID=A0A4U1B377_9GAMM|nr:NUDIX domain-containing protein [Thalassotalea mangrovi]TKB43546.1 NUDIX domain-containing protein [Thalassotalea mangrovi]
MFTFCPNCGQPAEPQRSPRLFQCQTCNFTFYHNVASAVAAVIIHNGKILLTQRQRQPGKGLWDLPGGFVDPGESLTQALSREINEELGIDINSWLYLDSLPNRYPFGQVTYSTCDSIFTAELAEAPDMLIQQEEIRAYRWIDKASYNSDEIAFASIREALNKYFD